MEGEHQLAIVANYSILNFPLSWICYWYLHTSVNAESAKWRAQHANVPYVLYVPTRPTCPRGQVYFIGRKIKKWKLCTHAFLRVLSLILDLNFRNYRSIQTGWLSLFSGTHRRKIPNRVFLLQQTYFLQQ